MFGCSVMLDSLLPYGLQHTILLCPSLSPRVYSNCYPLSQWCHPAVSSSVPCFSSCPQSFPASGSFPVSWLFTSGDQTMEFQLQHQSFQEYSGLISFRIDRFDLLAAQGMLKSLLQHHNSKASVLQLSAFFVDQLYHPYIITGKTITLTIWTFVSSVISAFSYFV